MFVTSPSELGIELRMAGGTGSDPYDSVWAGGPRAPSVRGPRRGAGRASAVLCGTLNGHTDEEDTAEVHVRAGRLLAIGSAVELNMQMASVRWHFKNGSLTLERQCIGI